MKKILIISFLSILSYSIMAQNNKDEYKENWLKIERYQEEDLPQSALNEVDKILQLATQHKNYEQVVKAMIHKRIFKSEIERQDYSALITELESYAKKTHNLSDKAILNSIIAELYNNSYSYYRWSVKNNTTLADDVPVDMKEWSENIFHDKTIEHIKLSLKDKDALLNDSIGKYSVIIYKGNYAAKNFPTVYDFVMQQAIKLGKTIVLGSRYVDESITKSLGLTIDEIASPTDQYINLKIKDSDKPRNYVFTLYQIFLKSLNDRGLTKTIAFTEMDKAELIGQFNYKFTSESLTATLKQMLERFKSSEVSNDIRANIAERLSSNPQTQQEAYTLCEEGIKAYPDYDGTKQLQYLIDKMEVPFIEFSLDQIIHPNTEMHVEYQFQNLVSLKDRGYLALTRIENGQPILVRYYKPEFKSEIAFQSEKSQLKLGKLPVGQYELVYIQNEDPKLSFRALVESAKTKHNYKQFTVSALASFGRSINKNNYEIIVVDRQSGKPMSDVTITTFTNSIDKKDSVIKTFKTDKQGLVLISTENDNNNYISYRITLGKDSCLRESYKYRNYYDSDNSQTKDEAVSIFTDRSIYRPGQIVYYKALVADSKGNLIKTNKTYNVDFFDPNDKKLTTVKLKTNEFGSIAGQFTIPKATILGGFRINIGNQSQYINVEEYKRPTFEVKFDSIESVYTYGAKVELTGNVKTFSGVNLQNTKVQYSISKNPRFPILFGTRGLPRYVTNGEVTTDADGKFSINFIPEKSENTNQFLHFIQAEIFSVTVSVTDLNGETQSATYPLTVSKSSILLEINITESVEKNSIEKLEIKATNFQEKPIEASGEYFIYSVNEKDSITDTKVSDTFTSGVQDKLKAELKNLPSGKYKIELKAKDKNEKESILSKYFTLFSYDDVHPAYQTNDWFIVKNNKFNDNKSAEVIVGSSSKDVHVFYTIYNNDKVFKRDFVKLNNSNHVIKIDYQNEYGDKVYLTTAAVINNKFYSHDTLLEQEVQKQDKKLVVKLDVFRDKLRPGQEETWTLKVEDKEGKPIIAEVLASMYDMSLDKLAEYTPWNISTPYLMQDLRRAYYNLDNANGGRYPRRMNLDGMKDISGNKIKPEFNSINWFAYAAKNKKKPGIVLRGSSSLGGSGNVSFATSAPQAKQAMLQQEEVTNYDEMSTVVEESAMDNGIAENNGATQIRSNFNETAFFYPQLRTNEKGETLVSFKVPESNTRWRFRVLAHDKNLKQGKLEEQVVTSKELMIIPNMPRFLRQGDKTNISTKVSNLSKKNISGKVSIEFFNPVTLEVVNNIAVLENEQAFSIESGASSSASWNFEVPANIDLLGCRIVAQSEAFSDGEQHALAVLPNKMLVTESMPFDIDKAGKATFTFDKLAQKKSTTAEWYRLTFEYTNSPAWYAVMAMPRLSTPNNESSRAWMHSYYVSAMSQSMVKRYPQLARMIEAWKNSDNKETLVSNLEKNDELKQILLQETPWVMDAKNETEIMESLVQLLDENNTRDYASRALNKLKELQSYDGGWTWFQGFKSNESITRYMLYAFYKLQSVGQVELPQEVKEMQMSALKFLDAALLKQYKDIKEKDKVTYTPSIYQLESLYIRSFYRDIPINQETREAERFFTEQISKNWTSLDLYGKSILAVLTKNNGEKDIAAKVTKSIKEYSITNKTLGTYWPKNTGNYSSSMLALGRHSFLTDALIANGATKEEIYNLTKWVIKSKQTQQWNESDGTLYTINSLWENSPELFSNSVSPTIQVGKTEIKGYKELGTEYIKQSWMGSEITKDKAKISINKPAEGIAFGNLTLQYYEDLNKIEASKGDLSIDKKLYKKVDTKTGEVLQQITEQNPLKVGDQVVVKLTIRSKIAMDYVHLKDMRAACFEPAETISQTKYGQGLFYYQTNNDASTNFFIDHINKGTYVIEYPVYVNRTGEYANGVSSIQCMYASELVSHTTGIKIIVE